LSACGCTMLLLAQLHTGCGYQGSVTLKDSGVIFANFNHKSHHGLHIL
jgi:hypothetical protein